MLGSLVDIIKAVVSNVQKQNKANPNVKTADSSVFDKVTKKIEAAAPKENIEEVCEDICNEVNTVQIENEADPNVETADKSVFEEMKKEIEALKAKMAAQNNATPAPTSTASVPPSNTSAAMPVMAITNSSGGSLAIRQQPDMGAPTIDVRIPESSMVNVLEYSTNSIILDGQAARFALVEYNGSQGWILESYLNFN